MSTQSRSTSPGVKRDDVDLRQLLATEPRHQGPRPLCVPFSFTTAHEARRQHQDGVVEALSVEPLWRHSLISGRASEMGTSAAAVAEGLKSAGQVGLEFWPYNNTLGPGTEDPPSGCRMPPWIKSESRTVDLLRDGVEEEIEDCLAAGFVVVLVIEITAGFWISPPDDTVLVPSIRDESEGYHAITIVGAAGDSPNRRFLIRNSWGTGWGAGGYAWMSPAYLVAFGAGARIVT